jgi:hypothetical protein
MMQKMSLIGALLAIAWISAPASAEDPWQVAARDETADTGYVLYSMDTGREGLLRYRLETTFPVSPDRAVEAVLEFNTSPNHVQEHQRREVLEETEDGAVVYTAVDMPMMVSDRDMAFRVTASTVAPGGVQRVSWHSVTDHPALPELREGTVRITLVEGHWEFKPDGPGRCRATYVNLTDVGGFIPSWLIQPMMRRQMTGDAQRLRDYVSRDVSVSAAPDAD